MMNGYGEIIDLDHAGLIPLENNGVPSRMAFSPNFPGNENGVGVTLSKRRCPKWCHKLKFNGEQNGISSDSNNI